jgi:hypothetical protein
MIREIRPLDTIARTDICSAGWVKQTAILARIEPRDEFSQNAFKFRLLRF